MCLACLHPGQARKNVGEVFTNINFQAAAVFHNGVEDGAFATGLAVSNEQPVFLAKLGRPDGVFNQVVVDLDPAVCQIPFEILPLIESVGDGFSQFALRKYPALAEFDDEAMQATVDHPAFRCPKCLSQGGTCLRFSKTLFDLIKQRDLMEYPSNQLRGLLKRFEKFPPHVGLATDEFEPSALFCAGTIYLIAVALDDCGEFLDLCVAECGGIFGILRKERVDSLGVSSFVPMEEDTSTRDVRRPEVAGLRFAAAGFKITDGGFVKLAVWTSPMFVLDFPVDDIEPIGTEEGPVAKSFAVELHSHAVKHFHLAVIGKVKDEAVVNDFGDESGTGDAALLQARWQRCDDRWGDGIVDADILAAHDFLAKKLGTLKEELHADFFANAPEGFGGELDLGRNDFFAFDGKVLGDAWGAGLTDFLMTLGSFDERGGRGFGKLACGGGNEVKKPLPRIDTFAGNTINTTAQSIEILTKNEYLCGLPRDDLIALGDFI